MGLMGGIFDAMGVGWDEGSADENSPYYAGGSFNIFGKDPEYTSRLYSMADKLTAYADANKSPVTFADKNGFMPYQYAGLNKFASMLGSKNSAAMSARGMNAPENYNAVVGSSLTQALPQLFSLQNQNQLLPGEVNKQNVFMTGAALAPLQQLGVVGQRTLGPGLGYNTVNTATQNWFDMWNKIGTFWGTKGMGGGGGSVA
jgi:hypothetical protein